MHQSMKLRTNKFVFNFLTENKQNWNEIRQNPQIFGFIFFQSNNDFFLDLLSEKSHLNYFNYKLILTITIYFENDLMNYK